MGATPADPETTIDYSFELSGGALCLDFTNTVGDRPRRENEHLHSYSDLISWADQAGVLNRSQIAALDSVAKTARAERVFARALELRESLFAIFARLAQNERPGSTDLATLNGWLAETLPHLQVEDRANRLTWSWTDEKTVLERPLWPVVRSAADLLTSDEIDRVRQCASETCSWLFVDRSRSHRRRWCDMKTCGNRDKARRYYARKRRSEASGRRSN